MSQELRIRIIAEARGWIGTPYRHQASLKGAGADCLGLVRGVWRALYGFEPEIAPAYRPDWAERGGGETLLEAAHRHLVPAAEPAPGDVLVFRYGLSFPARHCAVISTPDLMIHALQGRSVCETSIGPWWRRRIAGAFSFPETLAVPQRT